VSDPTSPDRLDVLAVAPHPDDLEILCGGTIAKLVKQGYKVGMADLTSGEPTPRGSLETPLRGLCCPRGNLKSKIENLKSSSRSRRRS
jgi:LmbE family N-acetylglucosaminyl deacetylase